LVICSGEEMLTIWFIGMCNAQGLLDNGAMAALIDE